MPSCLSDGHSTPPLSSVPGIVIPSHRRSSATPLLAVWPSGPGLQVTSPKPPGCPGSRSSLEEMWARAGAVGGKRLSGSGTLPCRLHPQAPSAPTARPWGALRPWWFSLTLPTLLSVAPSLDTPVGTLGSGPPASWADPGLPASVVHTGQGPCPLREPLGGGQEHGGPQSTCDAVGRAPDVLTRRRVTVQTRGPCPPLSQSRGSLVWALLQQEPYLPTQLFFLWFSKSLVSPIYIHTQH